MSCFNRKSTIVMEVFQHTWSPDSLTEIHPRSQQPPNSLSEVTENKRHNQRNFTPMAIKPLFGKNL